MNASELDTFIDYNISSVLIDAIAIWEKPIPYESSYFVGFVHVGIGVLNSYFDDMCFDTQEQLERLYDT